MPRKRKCILFKKGKSTPSGDVSSLGGRFGGSRRSSSWWELALLLLGSGTLVYIVWKVGLWRRTRLSDPRLPLIPPTAWGLAKKSLALWATAVAVPFAVRKVRLRLNNLPKVTQPVCSRAGI
ncbi:hypothetical protein HJG60_007912 [Phyllostomus discolor]|uniref:Uncharacterized protein n=1 Tax=Phyllostomus discolor TaxID=89673 RepID=A0A834BHT4_9CHIR|nr:hypothetical protein HJG60_007912 [Phyllostomus discolor]